MMNQKKISETVGFSAYQMRRVGGVLANHPNRRLLASQVSDLTGIKYRTVVKILAYLVRIKAIGRRKVFGSDTVHSFKIRQRRAKQLEFTWVWPGLRVGK